MVYSNKKMHCYLAIIMLLNQLIIILLFNYLVEEV